MPKPSDFYDLRKCTLCPRRCGADRTKGRGACGAGAEARAARAALHFGEEPCVSGSRGSGTVFFSGCNLRCVFCQNRALSHENYGREISVERLAEIMLELQAQGAHNINLVTPAAYTPHIAAALDMLDGRLTIPVLYNCGGYESAEALALMAGRANIYMPDFKYCSPLLSARYSGASDYAAVALPAIKEMLRQVGEPVFAADGTLQKGVIVRHLVLPGAVADSCEVLQLLHDELPRHGFLLSLMCQYTPEFLRGNFPELRRRLTTYEYRKVLDKADALGLDRGYRQSLASVGSDYTPHFGMEGL